MLGRGGAGRQPLKGQQLRVGRGQQARVKRAEEPGPLCGTGREERGLAGGVGRVHVPDQVSGRGRGGQLVARDPAERRRRAGAQDPDQGDGDDNERKPGAESRE
ncbi:MAG TPA: hypothetical protein VHF26_11470 [Trebonia sp.]|nr:hypothetical protein [Trebonia sp.]